jgi:predicted nuclease with TOPRIM domain
MASEVKAKERLGKRMVAVPNSGRVDECWRRLDDARVMDDYEVVAQELSELGEKWRAIEERLAEVERVNARLEEAALTTARALGEVSRHWDAVYDAMRRANRIDDQISTERDHEAARARRGESSD